MIESLLPKSNQENGGICPTFQPSNREELIPKNRIKWKKNNAVVFVLHL